jgi:hypothetical protein
MTEQQEREANELTSLLRVVTLYANHRPTRDEVKGAVTPTPQGAGTSDCRFGQRRGARFVRFSPR